MNKKNPHDLTPVVILFPYMLFGLFLYVTMI